MVIIIPPQSSRGTKPATQHDTTVGMLVVFAILMGIAGVIFAVGPGSEDPPPVLVGSVVLGLALIFGVIAFFSWIKEQSEDADASQDEIPKEE